MHHLGLWRGFLGDCLQRWGWARERLWPSGTWPPQTCGEEGKRRCNQSLGGVRLWFISFVRTSQTCSDLSPEFNTEHWKWAGPLNESSLVVEPDCSLLWINNQHLLNEHITYKLVQATVKLWEKQIILKHYFSKRSRCKVFKLRWWLQGKPVIGFSFNA